MADGGWPGAVAACAEIYHVASPMIQPGDPDEVIVPAREGHAPRCGPPAMAPGGVVLTSSFAACGLHAQAERRLHRGGLDRPGHPGTASTRPAF